MNDTPIKNKISVIVPVYGVEQYLDKCIESIVGQTYENLEIILVDDGSPDNCPAMCDKWARKDSRIKVIHKENGGLSDARNVGIEAATGEYLAFVDSDDWLNTEMYQKLYDAMIKEDADYCACNIVSWFNENRQIENNKREYCVGNSEEFIGRLYNQAQFPVAAWCKLVKRTTWGAVRFPVGKIYEDAFTTYRIIDRAEKIVQIPDALYYYRIRENSIMTSHFSLKRLMLNEVWKENYLFVKSHYPKYSIIARSFWLEHLPELIGDFPKTLTVKEKAAKKNIKKEIRENLWFAFTKMPLKKFVHQFIALFQ